MLSFRWDVEIYKEWIAGVDEACSFNLNQPLITRNEESKLITVNFDPQLVAVLREVKYLEIRSEEEVPEAAKSIYSRYDTLWKFTTNLDLTVSLYNKVRTTVLEVEFPLIEGQIADIDSKLQQAETALNWNSDGMYSFNAFTRCIAIAVSIHLFVHSLRKSYIPTFRQHMSCAVTSLASKKLFLKSKLQFACADLSWLPNSQISTVSQVENKIMLE